MISDQAAACEFDPAREVMLRRRSPFRRLLTGIFLTLRMSLQAEARELAVLPATCGLGLTAVLALSMILQDAVASEQAAAGALWGALLLTAPVGWERHSGGAEYRAALTFLLLSPAPRPAVFLGQWLFHSLLLLCAGGLALLAVTALLDTPISGIWIPVALIAGCMGFSAIGVAATALAAAMARGQGLLAALALPLAVPLFIAGLGLSGDAWSGAALADFRHWLLLILLYNGLMLIGGLWAADRLWLDWE